MKIYRAKAQDFLHKSFELVGFHMEKGLAAVLDGFAAAAAGSVGFSPYYPLPEDYARLQADCPEDGESSTPEPRKQAS